MAAQILKMRTENDQLRQNTTVILTLLRHVAQNVSPHEVPTTLEINHDTTTSLKDLTTTVTEDRTSTALAIASIDSTLNNMMLKQTNIAAAMESTLSTVTESRDVLVKTISTLNNTMAETHNTLLPTHHASVIAMARESNEDRILMRQMVSTLTQQNANTNLTLEHLTTFTSTLVQSQQNFIQSITPDRTDLNTKDYQNATIDMLSTISKHNEGTSTNIAHLTNVTNNMLNMQRDIITTMENLPKHIPGTTAPYWSPPRRKVKRRSKETPQQPSMIQQTLNVFTVSARPRFPFEVNLPSLNTILDGAHSPFSLQSPPMITIPYLSPTQPNDSCHDPNKTYTPPLTQLMIESDNSRMKEDDTVEEL